MNRFKIRFLSIIAAMTAMPALAQEISLTPDDVVTPPDGLESRGYSLSVSGVSSSFFSPEDYSDFGQYSELLFDNDGTVYFHDIMVDVGGWTRGRLDGNKITVDLPALQYWYDGFSDGVCLAAVKRIKDADGNLTCVYQKDITSVEFTVADDGTISLVSPGEEIGIGLVYTGDASFVGFADLTQTRVPFDKKVNEMPAGNPETWCVRESDTYMRTIDVARNDDRIYLKGVFESMPDAVIKGNVSDDSKKVSLEADQYLGLFQDYMSDVNIAYMLFGHRDGNDIHWYEAGIPLELTADFEQGRLAAAVNDYLLGNVWNTEPRYFEYIGGFSARRYRQTLNTPMAPCGLNYESTFEEYGYNRFTFSLPNISTDGEMLDPECYSYSIFFDGVPYRFMPSEYEDFQDIAPDGLERIPYSLSTGWEVYADKAVRDLIIYKNDFSRIGVQGYYTVGGETRTTPMVDITVSDGIPDITVREQIKTEYYNLAGVPVRECVKGITICKTTYSDGSVSIRKICR